MHRVDALGATEEGRFTEGDPVVPIPPTEVPATWLNMVQDELEGVLAAAGMAPDKATNAQVAAAIQQLIQDERVDLTPVVDALEAHERATLTQGAHGFTPGADGTVLTSRGGAATWESMDVLAAMRDANAGTLRMWPSLTIPTLADGLPLGLSLDGAVVSLAAFPRLARVACPAGDNAWAPAWYRCNSGGTRSASGTYIKLDDWRGGFPQALDLGRGNTQSTVLVKTTSGSSAVTVVNNLSDGGTIITPKTSTGGIYPGLAVSGTGIPVGAKVASVSGTTVTLTVAATATAASVEMTVTGRVLGSWQGDAMRNITGQSGGSIGGSTTANGAFVRTSNGDGLGSGQYGVINLDFVSSRVVPIAPTIRPAGPAFNSIILV